MRKITSEQRARILAARQNDKLTYKVIAEAEGVAYETARRICNPKAEEYIKNYYRGRLAGGIPAAKALTHEDRQLAVSMYLNGSSSTQLAAHFGYSYNTMLAVLREAGVAIRKPGTPPKKTPQLKSMPHSHDLDNIFTYHRPNIDDLWTYEQIRAQAKSFARFILNHTTESRERSLALTNLEQAVMWANAAIACQRTPEDEES